MNFRPGGVNPLHCARFPGKIGLSSSYYAGYQFSDPVEAFDIVMTTFRRMCSYFGSVDLHGIDKEC
jgi:hypothetical protein